MNRYNIWLASGSKLDYPEYVRKAEHAQRLQRDFVSDILNRGELCKMVRMGLFTQEEARGFSYPIRLAGIDILPAIKA